MDPAAIGILLTLLDRVITWTTVVKQAHDEGRPLTTEEVNSFVVADNESIARAKIAYDKAVAEGR